MSDHPNNSHQYHLLHQARRLLRTLEEFLLLAEPETIIDLQEHLERQRTGLTAPQVIEALTTLVGRLDGFND